MVETNYFIAALTAYSVNLPVLLVWLVGAGLAVAFWRKHPRISLLTLIALGIIILQSLVSVFSAVLFPTLAIEQNIDVTTIGYMMSGIGCGSSIIAAIAWGLILFAVFSGRTTPSES